MVHYTHFYNQTEEAKRVGIGNKTLCFTQKKNASNLLSY